MKNTSDFELYVLEMRRAKCYAKRDEHVEAGDGDRARFWDDAATRVELLLAEATVTEG